MNSRLAPLQCAHPWLRELVSRTRSAFAANGAHRACSGGLIWADCAGSFARTHTRLEVNLPNGVHAVIPLEKVRDYLLAAVNPRARGKAAFFQALGFEPTEWELLRDVDEAEKKPAASCLAALCFAKAAVFPGGEVSPRLRG